MSGSEGKRIKKLKKTTKDYMFKLGKLTFIC